MYCWAIACRLLGNGKWTFFLFPPLWRLNILSTTRCNLHPRFLKFHSLFVRKLAFWLNKLQVIHIHQIYEPSCPMAWFWKNIDKLTCIFLKRGQLWDLERSQLLLVDLTHPAVICLCLDTGNWHFLVALPITSADSHRSLMNSSKVQLCFLWSIQKSNIENLRCFKFNSKLDLGGFPILTLAI